jgi:hypothetical protein
MKKFLNIILPISLSIFILYLNTQSSFASQKPSSSPTASTNCQIYDENYVAAENLKKGTPTIYKGYPSHSPISIYLSSTYGQCGDTIKVYGADNNILASHKKEPPTISIYRLGYYNGAGARLTFADKIKTPLTPGSFKSTLYQSKTGISRATYTAKYNQVYSFTIPSTWTPGEYAIKLSSGNTATIAYLAIGNPGEEPILFVSATNTFQAYNTWGGASAYKNESYVIDYNRPIDGSARLGFRESEYPLIYLLEKEGYSTAIITDETFRQYPHILANHKVIIFGTHSEYWSQSEMDQVKAANASGAAVINFGGNEAYWRIRFEANRQYSIYKKKALDPNVIEPSIAFTTLQESSAKIFGTGYGCKRVEGNPVIPATSWLLKSTPLLASAIKNNNTTISLPPVFLGNLSEIDAVQKDIEASNVPQDTQYLSPTTIKCIGGSHATTWSIAYRPVSPTHGMVFNASTMGWGLSLKDIFSNNPTKRSKAENVSIMTFNVISKALNP